MRKECNVKYSNGDLICELPITTPTGKTRVLRKDMYIATRKTAIEKDDIIEWQISYFNKKNEMIELAELLNLAYKHNMVEKNKIKELLNEIKKQNEFFSEKYSIDIEDFFNEKNFYGFKLLKKVVPVLVKEIDRILIWIELRSKQKAIGFQPMLFLRIPITQTSPNIIGQIAEPNQILSWKIPLSVFFSTIKAFSIASKKHRDDMIDILERILGAKNEI